MIDRSKRVFRRFRVIYGPLDTLVSLQARSSLEAGLMFMRANPGVAMTEIVEG